MLRVIDDKLRVQVPNWSRVGRLKRSKFPSLGGGGHTFGGGAGAGVMTVLAGQWAGSNITLGFRHHDRSQHVALFRGKTTIAHVMLRV